MIRTKRDKLRMLTKGLRTRKFRKAGTSKVSERAVLFLALTKLG